MPNVQALSRINAAPLLLAQQEVQQLERGVVVYRRTDPLLLLGGLTRYPDEREYRRMSETSLAISNPARAINAMVMSFGWDVIPPRAKRRSKAAQRLRDYADAALSQIRNLEEAVEVAGDRMVYHGWTPMQALWHREAFWHRGSRWGPVKLQEKNQEHFGILYEPDADVLAGPTLVVLGQQGGGLGPPRVFNTEGDRLAWMVLTSGSSEPYGRALFRDLWLPLTVWQEFFQLFARGMRNATQGIPKLKESILGQASPLVGEIDPKKGVAAITQLAIEAQEVIRILDEYGVLIVRAGVDYDLLTNIAFSDGWLAALQYLARQIQIGIEGQHLTAELGEKGGARALGDTQERTKLGIAQWKARRMARMPNTLIRRVVEVGIPNVDPEDMPIFRLKICDRPDREDLRFLLDYGARLDLEQLADTMHAPLAAEDAEESMVLAKPQAVTLPASNGGEEERRDRGPGEALPDQRRPKDAEPEEPG